MKLSSRFESAFSAAASLHATQVRKGTDTPYIAHLLAVASLVLEHGGTEDEAIAALLHDAVEDQGGLPTLQRIRDEFGDAVADIVAECTDTHEDPKPDWRQRKELYIASIAKRSPSALLVSLADKLHNSRSILSDYRQTGDALWQRFRGKKEGTLWYYRSLAKAFQKTGPEPLATEFRSVVGELDRLVANSD
jgi:GTP pyrophosphokinase